MIPFLVLLAVAYWLAAPDPVTAGARTAAGSGARAAGSGARAQWAAGRKDRAVSRTKRRDRWHKAGGLRRSLLGLEHAAVVASKVAKGSGKLAGAAVRPVPAAARAGWSSGWERHRARAKDRPVPIVVDPPWWRRDTPPEQAPGQPAGQGQDTPGDTPEASPRTGPEQAAGTGAPPAATRTATIVVGKSSSHCSRCLSPALTEWTECRTCQAIFTAVMSVYGEYVDAVRTMRPDIPLVDVATAPEGPLAGTSPDGQAPTTEPAPAAKCFACDEVMTGGWFVTPNGPACADHVYFPPFPTDQPAGTSPAGVTPTTEGDPVFTGIDTDLDDLTTVQDFALKVADMAEESDFAQLVEFCKNASDEVRDFGADMAGDVAEFEEVAAKIGDLLSELVDAATKVKDRGAELVGG